MTFKEFCEKHNITEKETVGLLNDINEMIGEILDLSEYDDPYDEYDVGFSAGCYAAANRIQEFFGIESEDQKKKRLKEERIKKTERQIRELCDSPKIPNKHNLTMEKIRKLKVLRPEKTTDKPFCKNSNFPGKWQLVTSVCSKIDGMWFEDAFFSMIGNDKEVEQVSCTVMEMCNYNFNNFYDPEEIETTADFEIQEKILEKINPLIDNGIFGLTED